MFVSHSVFKDQKIIFNVFGAAFDALLSALKRRVRYVIDNQSSTAFFKLFFRTISCSNSANFTARFAVNKAGDSTHIKNPRNFFLSFFSPSQKPPQNPYFQAFLKTTRKTPRERPETSMQSTQPIKNKRITQIKIQANKNPNICKNTKNRPKPLFSGVLENSGSW